MDDLGSARVHSAEAACSAYRMAWSTGPGYCFATPEWAAYDAAHSAHLRFYRMQQQERLD